MKKITAFLLTVAMGATLCAQNIVISPTRADNEDLGFMGVAMTHDGSIAVGTDMISRIPCIWNTTTNAVTMILDTENYDGNIQYRTGTLNAISENGIAVGSLTTVATQQAFPIMVDVNNADSYTSLYTEENCFGSVAYGISADGSTIVGFYYGEDWQATGCIWTSNGTVRTDLPMPTVEQMGHEIDYVAARWISADGNTILGYAQDYNTGSWVALAWRKNGSSWEPVCFARDYFQTVDYDDEGNVLLPEPPNPYFTFEPLALSADGNYATLRLVELYDLDDWDYIPYTKAARYNFTTNTLEVLEDGIYCDDLLMYGVANDGTCVGRKDIVNEITMNTLSEGVMWNAGANNEFLSVSDLLQGTPYANGLLSSSLHAITPDGSKILGFVVAATGDQLSVLLTIDTPAVGIDEVTPANNQPRVKGIYDLSGRKLNSITRHGIYIIDGVKVVR